MENIICLDTNVIIEIIKNKNFNEFNDYNICTTCINVFELSCWESPNIDNKIILQNLVEDIQTYGLTKDIAISAGKIFLEIQRRKINLDFRDILIAAICIENKLHLKTYNEKHFESLKEFGLKIFN